MALIERLTALSIPRGRDGTDIAAVPLAWRNLVLNKQRLIRSIAGIAFAVLLMMVQIGFRNAFTESMLLTIRALDADIVLTSSSKYQFVRQAPFSRRQLYAARAVSGVATVHPLYLERMAAVWKNPQDHRLFAVAVFGFDPDQPVFRLPEVSADLQALRQADTVMLDRRARHELGEVTSGTETELSRRKIKVVGTFSLGPDFFSYGNVLTSDRNFFKLFGNGSSDPKDLPDVEAGIVKVLPGRDVAEVQRLLRAALPASVSVLTKSQLLEQEARFNRQTSPVGPIFDVGTLVGFVVGMLISYQIIFSELSDHLSQYSTLKAMGYHNGFLVKVVVQQAIFYAVLGYMLAWLLCYLVLKIIGQFVLLPMGMSIGLTAISFALTLIMCIGSALIAVRRVIAADPAELF